MLQIVLQAPGQLAAATVEAPEPADGEALVRVHRIGICGTDLHAFRGSQPFFSYPRVLGHELAVEVVDVRRATAGVTPGDYCSVEPYLECGRCIACRRGRLNCCTQLKVLGVHCDGGMRPFITIPAGKLHPSRRLTLDQLALVETLAIGAHAVERAALEPGEYALVVGAGPIGLATVQFARAAGARMAVLDLNRARLDFCREQFGVAATIEASGADLEPRLREVGDGDLPTAVFDASGHAASMQAAFERVAPSGRIVFVGLVQGDIAFNDPEFHRKEITLLASRNALPSTFRDIIRAIEAGQIDTAPWITHRLHLADVPDVFPRLTTEPTLIKAMIELT